MRRWSKLESTLIASGKISCLSEITLILSVNLFVSSPQLPAQDQFTFELFSGVPYNVPLPLTIRQSGQPDIRLTARFDSEPFVTPFYWVWRIGFWSGNGSWEFEAVHHKLYLTNNPPDVQHFEITHGLNYFTINRGWELHDFVFRFGVGVLLAHPENTVRGSPMFQDQGILNWGYYLRGPAVNLAAAKQLRLSDSFYLIGEAKLSAANVSVPVHNGSAHLLHAALQATIGIGVRIANTK